MISPFYMLYIGLSWRTFAGPFVLRVELLHITHFASIQYHPSINASTPDPLFMHGPICVIYTRLNIASSLVRANQARPKPKMMRRRHKKSRRGCLECKRRHIKCDETRPHCINCTTAERDCSYPTTSGSDGTSTTGHSPTEGPRFSVSASPPMSSFVTPAGVTPSLVFGEMPQFNLGGALGGIQEVNMVHMELFHHFMTNNMSGYQEHHPEMGELVKTASVRHALREPYLMYQVLALAARHLCFVRPDSAAFYQSHAINLQTHAISIFNSLDVGYLQRATTNLVSVFLFSSSLGFQSLCDVLSHRDHDFPSALARFLVYLRLHRGVNRILEGHGHQLNESDVAPILELSRDYYTIGGSGHECDDIRRRILLVPDLSNEALEATLKAIDMLQYVIDGEPHAASRAHVLLPWPLLIGGAFVGLLEAGRPEALAVLGYYFLALHHCRDVWMFCGSGHYLLTSLSTYLGPKWGDWVATPCRLLRESLEREDAESLVESETNLFLSEQSGGQASTSYWKQ